MASFRDINLVTLVGMVDKSNTMGFRDLEMAILAELRYQVRNLRLPLKRLNEWSTSREQVLKNLRPDEVMVHLERYGVWCAILKGDDRRKPLPDDKGKEDGRPVEAVGHE